MAARSPEGFVSAHARAHLSPPWFMCTVHRGSDDVATRPAQGRAGRMSTMHRGRAQSCLVRPPQRDAAAAGRSRGPSTCAARLCVLLFRDTQGATATRAPQTGHLSFWVPRRRRRVHVVRRSPRHRSGLRSRAVVHACSVRVSQAARTSALLTEHAVGLRDVLELLELRGVCAARMVGRRPHGRAEPGH